MDISTGLNIFVMVQLIALGLVLFVLWGLIESFISFFRQGKGGIIFFDSGISDCSTLFDPLKHSKVRVSESTFNFDKFHNPF